MTPTALATADPYALPALWVSILSLVVAVLAALTAMTALAWQIATRRRGAHRVTLVASYTKKDGLIIVASNSGAANVQVRAWGLMSNKSGWEVVVQYGSRILAAGNSIDIPVDADNLQIALRRLDNKMSGLRPYVRLGTGQRIRGRREIHWTGTP